MDEADWARYGKAVIASMQEVLSEAAEEHHPILLETADYWLSLGLAIALRDHDAGRRLLDLIEEDEPARRDLDADAITFTDEVLGR